MKRTAQMYVRGFYTYQKNRSVGFLVEEIRNKKCFEKTIANHMPLSDAMHYHLLRRTKQLHVYNSSSNLQPNLSLLHPFYEK